MSKMEKETRLKLAIALSLVFMLIEVVGGYVANSIAIFSDAAHLLTDIAGFGIALVATLASKAPATKRLTFGFARAEVFGALASVLSLWVITFFLLYAAYDRALKWYLGRAEEVNGFLMFIVACFGVVVNICLGYVFHEDHGGGLHPGHSHEHHHHHSSDVHSDSGSYQKVDLSDLESPAGDNHDHGHDHGHGHGHGHDDGLDCTGHDHSEKKRHTSTEDYEHIHDDHDHGHDHEKEEGSCSGHDHNHHSTATEKSPLLGGHKAKSYTDDHSHDKIEHDHHGHDHHDHHGHDHHGHREHSDHHDDHHDHHGHGGEHLHESDVNIEAAYLHVLTDLIQSIGVAIASVNMWRYPHYEIIDPICTLVFSIIALYSTLPLLSRVFLILFEGTPTQVIKVCHTMIMMISLDFLFAFICCNRLTGKQSWRSLMQFKVWRMSMIYIFGIFHLLLFL